MPSRKTPLSTVIRTVTVRGQIWIPKSWRPGIAAFEMRRRDDGVIELHPKTLVAKEPEGP